MPRMSDHVCYYCCCEVLSVVKLPDITPKFFLCLNCSLLLDADGTMLTTIGNFPALYNPS
jgi:hypothetical protein